jgi:hypothetical protein
VELFWSFRYKSMSPANMDNLTSSFSICIFKIFSSYLIALTRNFKTMLNKSGKDGHSCIVSNFRGNGFSFSTFSMMLALTTCRACPRNLTEGNGKCRKRQQTKHA